MDILFHLLYTWIPASLPGPWNGRRNDGKGPYPKFGPIKTVRTVPNDRRDVSPAKAGVQCMGFKSARPPTDDVLTIMDRSVLGTHDVIKNIDKHIYQIRCFQGQVISSSGHI
jgi:hypothetical protein